MEHGFTMDWIPLNRIDGWTFHCILVGHLVQLFLHAGYPCNLQPRVVISISTVWVPWLHLNPMVYWSITTNFHSPKMLKKNMFWFYKCFWGADIVRVLARHETVFLSLMVRVLNLRDVKISKWNVAQSSTVKNWKWNLEEPKICWAKLLGKASNSTRGWRSDVDCAPFVHLFFSQCLQPLLHTRWRTWQSCAAFSTSSSSATMDLFLCANVEFLLA